MKKDRELPIINILMKTANQVKSLNSSELEKELNKSFELNPEIMNLQIRLYDEIIHDPTWLAFMDIKKRYLTGEEIDKVRLYASYIARMGENKVKPLI